MSGSKRQSKRKKRTSSQASQDSPAQSNPQGRADSSQGDPPDEGASPAAERERNHPVKSTNWLLWASLALVLFVTVHGVSRALAPNTREHELELPKPEQEKVELPQALSNRDLPLDELYRQMKGANLERPLVHVALFNSGKWEGEAWSEGTGVKRALSEAFTTAQRKSRTQPDTAILVFATDRTQITPSAARRHFSNIHRGIRAVQIETGKDVYRLSPTETIATNRKISDELEKQAKKRDKDVRSWFSDSKLYSVATRQFFVDLSSNQKAIEMLRGNRLIAPESVTKAGVVEFEKLLTDWMFENLHEDGRMTYTYYPSRGDEARTNNMIRQWMATVAMGRASRLHPERNVAARAERNIEYNLKHFYRSNDEFGWIEYRNTAKLGAAALAMISLIESPAREKFEEQEKGLFALTNHLWTESGKFYCFYLPASRKHDSLHNFYPGETLLGWSFLYEQDPNPQLLERSMQSYRFYKDWHLKNRNPAFIPWHTQAYYNLWKETKDDELADWIFTMNDWLVDVMQTNSRVAYDDTLGRFYDPVGGRYGVPHASSTGVYLEGLIDAFALARALGDTKHVDKYRESILLGLRSSMQLQFQDEIDMFYAQNRERLRGGMRTTVYDNAIRVDNVQHVLMGVQKILREFRDDDYRKD